MRLNPLRRSHGSEPTRPRPRVACPAALIFVAALVAGCGSSSSSGGASASGANAVASSSIPSSPLAADLQRTFITADAPGRLIAAVTSLPLQQQYISQLRDSAYTNDLALRKLSVAPSAQQAYVRFLTASGQLIAALDRLHRISGAAALDRQIRKTTPAITRYFDALRALRLAAKVPDYPWAHAQPKGRPVYSDNLTAPHGQIKWLLGPNVRYGNGGLLVSTTSAGHNGQTGPTTPYNFDGRRITVEADAQPIRGSSYYGIMCPPDPQTGASLTGQLAPGGKFSFGIVNLGHQNILLQAPATSSAIKAGVNHLRLDCQQFAPGAATARLYVNGQYLGFADAGTNIAPNREAGFQVVAASTHGSLATVKFSNWSVSTLGR